MIPLQRLEALEYAQPGGFALRVAALDILPARIYALTGPNGAGKSTLLRLMALLEAPQSGRIFCQGEEITTDVRRQEWRRRITLLHQSPYLFAGSVAQNIAFGLKLRGLRGRALQERIDTALEMVGLSGLADRPAKQLSGGESQRTALARALALQPQLLLLDEPTAGLDRAGGPAFEALVAALPQRGMSVVLSTHDPEQPRRLGAEIVSVEAGQVTPFTSAQID